MNTLFQLFHTPELEAIIYYLTKEEGGRETEVNSGYRGQFFYDDHNWGATQVHLLVRDSVPARRDNFDVLLKTMRFLHIHVGKFYVGKEV